jgi:hypothetical protein
LELGWDKVVDEEGAAMGIGGSCCCMEAHADGGREDDGEDRGGDGREVEMEVLRTEESFRV